MKRLVLIRPHAEADLQEAWRWYEQRRAGLGDDFVAIVRRTVRSLEKNAEKYPFYYRGFRRVLLRRFPYKVFFRVEGERVIVFRILHVKQDHQRHFGD